jgi:hypothetical protein
MSKVQVSGNALGSGTVTLAAPNTNSDYTLSLPAVTAEVITNSSGVLDIGSGQVYKDASGNVGIGTSSPGSKLHVVGQIEASTDTTTPAGGNAYFYKASAGAVISGFANVFETGGLGSRAERARINTGGQLLLGTSSGLGTNSRFAVQFAGGGSEYGMTMRPVTNSTVAIEFQNAAGSGIGAVAITSTGTSFNTTSDYRLKQNVAPMTGGLATVAALKPCTYTWKADGSAGQGFIAHELQAVVPDCVTGEKDAVEIVDDLDAEGKKIGTKEVPRYQGVDTSFLVATLVAAIQEQQTIIANLTTRLEALEAI